MCPGFLKSRFKHSLLISLEHLGRGSQVEALLFISLLDGASSWAAQVGLGPGKKN